MNEILHTIIDVLAGRRNLAAHEADKMHETLTPGYTIPLPSATDVAAAQALLARAATPPTEPTTTAGTSADPAATASEGSAS